MRRIDRRQVVGALAILLATCVAIRLIAESRAASAVGPGAYPIDEAGPDDRARFEELLADLDAMGRPQASRALADLAARGRVWIAPALEDRQGLHVEVPTIRRIYVAQESLREPERWAVEVPPGKKREGMDVQRASTRIQRAGTILHELAHHDGLADEDRAYAEEIRFYEGIRDSEFYRREPEPKRRILDTAIEHSIRAAEEARGRSESGSRTEHGEDRRVR